MRTYNWELIIVWLAVLALGCSFWYGFFRLAVLGISWAFGG